jgi:hypothetical protein
MDITEEILTQLMDHICEHQCYSKRVIYDKFQEKREQLVQGLEEDYSKEEIRQIKERIQAYDFLSIILSFSKDTD